MGLLGLPNVYYDIRHTLGSYHHLHCTGKWGLLSLPLSKEISPVMGLFNSVPALDPVQIQSPKAQHRTHDLMQVRSTCPANVPPRCLPHLTSSLPSHGSSPTAKPRTLLPCLPPFPTHLFTAWWSEIGVLWGKCSRYVTGCFLVLLRYWSCL